MVIHHHPALVLIVSLVLTYGSVGFFGTAKINGSLLESTGGSFLLSAEGVGKTTATWALAHVASLDSDIRSLMFDLDAQMSLTQAVALNEDGSPFKSFSDWYDRSTSRRKTIFDALDEFTKGSSFNFGINHDFVYKISENYHFIPSVEDLYWTELE